MDYTQVIVSIIALLSVVITAVVAPFVKSKISAEKQAQLEKWAYIGACAAEKLFIGEKRGEEKREYVEDLLAGLSKKAGLKFDAKVVRAAIESAVVALSQKGV